MSAPRQRQHSTEDHPDDVRDQLGSLLAKQFVNPCVVQQGSLVRVGAYVHSQTPTEVRGDDVTVILPEGFVSTDGAGHQCTRTFDGQTLVEGGPPLDGTFVVIAPLGARDSICEASVTVGYSGDLDIADDTVSVPFVLVKPPGLANERALTVTQAMVPQARAGEEVTAIVEHTATRANRPVNPGTIRQEFHAPANSRSPVRPRTPIASMTVASTPIRCRRSRS